jgi:small multidrug resistance pump
MHIWAVLMLAIVFEVSGTTCLKLSEGFTKPTMTIITLVCYSIGLFLMALTLKKLDLGLVYAIWSGLGTALVAVIGMIYFKDTVTIMRISSLALIIIGVIGLHASTLTKA